MFDLEWENEKSDESEESSDDNEEEYAADGNEKENAENATVNHEEENVISLVTEPRNRRAAGWMNSLMMVFLMKRKRYKLP